MLLAQMPQHVSSHGIYVRPDKEQFAVKSVLFESPSKYDHWLADFTITHASWAPSAFRAIIPKRIARTVAGAKALLAGPILDQVKSNQLTATAQGRAYAWVPSTDGWHLMG